MAAYKAVLLDADGTLWHSRQTGGEVWHGLLSDLGVNLPLERAEEAYRKAFQALTPEWQALETSGVPAEQSALDALFDRFNRLVQRELGVELDLDSVQAKIGDRFIDSWQLHPDTLPVLRELRDSYRMAIVSNGVYQEETSRRLGIAAYFDAIIGSLHVGFRKPMRQIFQMALDALGVGPEHAVMVGDNFEADVLGAEAAGIKGIHIIRNEESSKSSDAIKDLWGLVDFLRQGGSV